MAYSFSDHVQRGILYLLKYDMDFFSQIISLIKPEYFEFPSYQRIFSKVLQYHDTYRKIPSDEILLEYLKKDLPETESISDYKDDLTQISRLDQSILENREFIMDLVESFAKNQAMKEAIKKSYTMLKDGKIDGIEQIVREALLVSRNLDLGQVYFDSFDDRMHRLYVDKDKNKFKTVFSSCNQFLDGGNSAKELCMVIAPPGVGKSLYLVNQAVVSLMENRKVLYISLEMSEDKIAQRFDSVVTLLNTKKLTDGAEGALLNEKVKPIKERLKTFRKHFPESRLMIKEFPTGQANVNTIRAFLSQIRVHHDFVPDVIIVDYLELLRPNRIIDAEYQAQQRIAEELRGLAVELKCLLWTATQTNRQGRKVALITDAELGDSYGKIRTADWAISLNQTKEDYDAGRLKVYVVKARDSKQHYTIPVAVNYSTLKMEELEGEEAEACEAIRE